MRVVLQRVSRAAVTIGGDRVSEIGRGYLLLVAAGTDDGEGEADRLAEKIVNLRVFPDSDGRMNLPLAEVGGEVLIVSQFTLYGDVRRGRRPSWTGAAPPEVAEERIEAFARAIEALGVRVARGVFRADMQVELVNDGPVTLVLDGAAL
jgi:D-tyrosyl-tRNA(Tyr) deacylase